MRSKPPSPVLRRVALLTALGVLAIPFVVPTVWMVAASVKPLPEIFKSPPSLWTSDPTLSAYSEAFGFQPFARQYLNSVYIAVLVTLITLLVSSLAEHLSRVGRLPYLGALASRGPVSPPQHNSAQRLRTVLHALTLDFPVPPGPVLLVDDRSDSGWTLTVAAKLLREAGATAVLPLVLAVPT